MNYINRSCESVRNTTNSKFNSKQITYFYTIQLRTQMDNNNINNNS